MCGSAIVIQVAEYGIIIPKILRRVLQKACSALLANWLLKEARSFSALTRSMFYKKRSKNLASLDFAFLYSCFLFLMMHFG